MIRSPDFPINRHFHITLQNDVLVLSMGRVDCSVRSSGFPHPSEQRLKRWGAPLGAPMLLHPARIFGDIVGGHRAAGLFDCYVQVFFGNRCLQLGPFYFTYLLRRFASYLATHCHHRCISKMYKYVIISKLLLSIYYIHIVLTNKLYPKIYLINLGTFCC